MSTTWKIDRIDVDGTTLATLTPSSEVANIDMIALGADGDCREAVVTARADLLAFEPRDWARISISDDGGSTFTPIFLGVCTEPGAHRSKDLSTLRFIGGRKALLELDTRNEQFLSVDVAIMARRFLGYGAGGTPNITYASQDVPETGFSGSFDAKFNTVGACLDQLAERLPGFIVPTGETYVYDGVTFNDGDYVPPVTWGVRADGSSFFRRNVTPAEAWTEGTDFRRAESIESTSETITTRVVFIAVTSVGPLRYVYNDTDAQDEYGIATKYVAAPASLVRVDATAGTVIEPDPAYGKVEASDDGGATWSAYNEVQHLEYLSDGNEDTLLRFTWYAGAGDPTGAEVDWGFRIQFDPHVEASVLALEARTTQPTPLPLVQPRLYLEGTFTFWNNTNVDATSIAKYLAIFSGSASIQNDTIVEDLVLTSDYDVDDGTLDDLLMEVSRVQLYEAAWEDTETLDRVGAALIRTPAPEAADLLASGYVAPPPRLTVTLLDGSTLPAMDVEDVEVRISKEEGLRTRVRLGAREDAEEQARSELIRGLVDNAERDTVMYLAEKELQDG